MQSQIRQQTIDNGCDLCKQSYKEHVYDARSHFGWWAFMCTKCFKEKGVGLGVGKGQKYSVETRKKLEG